MFTSSLDMCLVREFDVLFLEFETKLLGYLSTDSVFIDATEELGSLPPELHLDMLPIEHLLYVECLFEAFTGLILSSLFVLFEFFESLRSDFFHDSLWDERVASLRSGHLDDISFASEVSNILEEFDGELVGGHSFCIKKIFHKYMEDRRKVKGLLHMDSSFILIYKVCR